MTNPSAFSSAFRSLTGNAPFPWQEALFDRFIGIEPTSRFPDTCDIPTGLGKTSVIAVWVLALAHHARNGSARMFPRRLVYVVNRRTVVDQSTREAMQLRVALRDRPELKDVADALRSLGSQPDCATASLAISTLRGEFADNAEWRDDPSRPAVVVGTVDMIGSRLLFNGYGRGFKSRPLHAAFLAQDALLVHDEAHLEPAFQVLVEAICKEQQLYAWEKDRFHVMALSATARSGSSSFTLTARDLEDSTVIKRINAKKGIAFHHIEDGKKISDAVAALALHDDFKESGQAILIFVQQVKDVEVVADHL
ncbi:MAG TPA: type I-U CRISPR-associated helicase/endonuclease Cas3, partial [Polyangiaceae bacterium]|nr:type I-U CRISPR-associated helicase/endonuclease Cas3 [Polyangiaceae bacterium]